MNHEQEQQVVIERMTELRLYFTRPVLADGGGVGYEWTDPTAEKLYKTYGDLLVILATWSTP